MTINHMLTAQGLQFVLSNGQPMFVSRTNSAYFKVKQAIQGNHPEAQIMGILTASVNPLDGPCTLSQDLVFNAGILYLDGQRVPESLSAIAQSMAAEGFSLDGFGNFVENLMDNPSYTVVNEMYAYMERNRFVFTQDGFILGYRVMPAGASLDAQRQPVRRNSVDDDMSKPCGAGLDVYSFGSLPHPVEPGSAIQECRVHPADVVNLGSSLDIGVLRVTHIRDIRVIQEEVSGFVEVQPSTPVGSSFELFVQLNEGDAFKRVGSSYTSLQDVMAEGLAVEGAAATEIRSSDGNVVRRIT